MDGCGLRIELKTENGAEWYIMCKGKRSKRNRKEEKGVFSLTRCCFFPGIQLRGSG